MRYVVVVSTPHIILCVRACVVCMCVCVFVFSFNLHRRAFHMVGGADKRRRGVDAARCLRHTPDTPANWEQSTGPIPTHTHTRKNCIFILQRSLHTHHKTTNEDVLSTWESTASVYTLLREAAAARWLLYGWFYAHGKHSHTRIHTRTHTHTLAGLDGTCVARAHTGNINVKQSDATRREFEMELSAMEEQSRGHTARSPWPFGVVVLLCMLYTTVERTHQGGMCVCMKGLSATGNNNVVRWNAAVCVGWRKRHTGVSGFLWKSPRCMQSGKFELFERME